MSNQNDRSDSPAEVKQALMLAFGRTLAPHLAPVSLPAAADAANVAAASHSHTSSVPPSAHWDPALLHQVQATLAEHVGPIAAVLVRRNAATCHDMPTLCERLAEQVTTAGGSNGGNAGNGHATRSASALTGTGPGAIADSLVTASAQVLASYLGPIAPLVARRAAATAPDRAAYFGALEATIAGPEKRAAVRTRLDKLH